jgi:hypothetical protein
MASNIKQELKILNYIKTNQNPDVQILYRAYKAGVICSSSQNNKIKELYTVFQQAEDSSRAIEFNPITKAFTVSRRDVKRDLDSYGTRAEDLRKPDGSSWRDKAFAQVRVRDPENVIPLNKTTYYTQSGVVKSYKRGEEGRWFKRPMFGLELEVESLNSPDESSGLDHIYEHTINAFGGNTQATVKYDGSLSDGYGFELVTSPQTFTDLKKIISTALNNRHLTSRLEVTSSCGIHIHLSAEPLDLLQIGFMTYFINNPKMDSLLCHIGGRKASHSYSRRYYEKFKESLDNNKLSVFIRQATWYLNNRGAIHYSRRHNTIEFRMFDSSLDAETVLSYLEFVDALKSFCVLGAGGVSFSKNQINPEDFILWLLDSDRLNRIPQGFTRPRVEYSNLIRRIVLDFYPTAFTVQGNLVSTDIPKLTTLLQS